MAQSPATLKLKSLTLGSELLFEKEEMPLISRRISSDRQDDQGPSIRRIDVTLNGFHHGKNLAEVQTKHRTLIAYLRSNELELEYSDGVTVMINQQIVWVDDYNEPSEWMQYTGNYTVSLHYFQSSDCAANETIQASFVNSYGTFTFDPPPLFGISAGRPQGSFRASDFTPKNVADVFNQQDEEHPITRVATITLEGFMIDNLATSLAARRDQLFTILAKKGTLNYGAYTSQVTPIKINFPLTFPRFKCYYTIEFQTDLMDGVRYLATTRSIPRVHRNPLIRERPQCNLPPYVMQSGLSGQEVRYGFHIQGDSMASMRATLATEASYAIVPGGVEMPGGVMEEDDDQMGIHLTIIKFYTVPVVPNLQGTDDFTAPPQQ